MTPTHKIRYPEWSHIHERDKRIDELEAIIAGALAHSYGPYSDQELLRRVVVVLKKAAKAEGEEAGS